jgi:hypothetical protein
MVVWEDGAMKKSDYRKFQVKTVTGVDDFASMREIIHRRYKRCRTTRSLPLADPDRRRPGPAARRRRRARRDRRHARSRWPPSPSAKRSSTSTGRRMTPSSSTAARRCCTDPEDPRREPPLRRHLPSQTPPDARPRQRTRRHPRRRPAHPPAPAGALRQRTRDQAGEPGCADAVVSPAVAEKIRLHFTDETVADSASPLVQIV